MIFSFEGNQREGKSLGATALALWLSKRVGFIPIIANYHLTNLPPQQKFSLFNKPQELKGLQNCIVIHDEVGTSTDSRSWGSQGQILFTHTFAQMGKNGVTYIYTAQRDNLVEKRVRQQTDFVIECTKDYFNKQMYQEWYNAQRGRDRMVLLGKFLVTNPERIYGYYDTYETIASHVNFEDNVGNKR